LISPTPFVRPDHPGTLVIPSGSTAHMREAIRDAHNAAKSHFETVEAVGVLRETGELTLQGTQF